MRRDGALEPLYVPRDTKILDYSRTILFNDVVRYLRAAGYAGGSLVGLGLTIPQMVVANGAVNAFGLVLCGILAWALEMQDATS